MKREGHLFEKMIRDENIRRAIFEVNRTHRTQHHRPNKTVERVEADIDGAVKALRAMAEDESFQFPKPRSFTIFDKSAGKERNIKQPSIWPSQYLHHMAIQAGEKIFMRGMDHWCCGSIRGRGAAYGMRGMKKWMKDDHKGTKWAMEADIHHFYDSLKPKAVMYRLRHIIKDERYLSFCEKMMGDGVSIGAYFSQWFANVTLQPVDAAIRKCGVDHYMRYMDNFTLLAGSKRKLRNAKKELERRLRIIGLRLKGNWQIFRTEHRMVTALGYRFGHGFTLLRKRNLMRLKRQTARVLKIMRRKAKVSFQAASGLISRIGQLTHCNSENIRKKYIPRGLLKQLKNIVRKECKKWKALNTFSVTTATQ